MKKIASSDLLAASMNEIMDSEEHKTLFAKPQMKIASKKTGHPLERAFSKLIQASEKLENLGLTHSSLRIMALASALTKQAAWDEEAHQKLVNFIKDIEADTGEEVSEEDLSALVGKSQKSLSKLPLIFDKIKELSEETRNGSKNLPYEDLMDRGKETNLDPENIAVELTEPANPLYEEMGWFDDEDLIEQVYIGDNADKTVSNEEEHGSLFEQLRGDK